MASLSGLAVYWETDAKTIVGSTLDETLANFKAKIPQENSVKDYSFILKPVSGMAKVPHLGHNAIICNPM